MKRLGYNDIITGLEKGAIIRLNTMPYTIPNRPDVGLYTPNGKSTIYGTMDELLGSIRSDTFYKLLENKVIERTNREFSYDVYKKI